MNIVIGIYSHPEFFPPTLHALQVLSREYDQITLVSRNQKKPTWPYPANVKLINDGGPMLNPGESEQQSLINKVRSFARFARCLAKTVKKEQPAVLLVYDSIALFAVKWARKLGWMSKKIPLWYHSHDVSETGNSSRYSITFRASLNERSYLKHVDFFSIPSAERLSFFPMKTFKGKHRVIPNYPSLQVLSIVGDKKVTPPAGTLKLIYQGNLTPGHGFEELISILGEKISGQTLQLVLTGLISDAYRRQLEHIAAAAGTTDHLVFTGRIDYRDLFATTVQQHIGLAIHLPENIIYSTGGTASNKIYEYAAVGLPVMLYDNEHYRKHLAANRWAFFTDLTPASLRQTIEAIVNDFDALSRQAQEDFKTAYNYETHFGTALEYFGLTRGGLSQN